MEPPKYSEYIYSFICFKATAEIRNFYELNVLYMVYVADLEYYYKPAIHYYLIVKESSISRSRTKRVQLDEEMLSST